jgi:hypothetical protein
LGKKKKIPFQPMATQGPRSEKSPECKWGNVVKDEVNEEWVWFGGTGGVSQEGALYTYIFKEGNWIQGNFAKSEQYNLSFAISKQMLESYMLQLQIDIMFQNRIVLKKMISLKVIKNLEENLRKNHKRKKIYKIIIR